MSRVEQLDRFARAARRRWLENAAHQHFGMCGSCGRTHDGDGKPLYVARQRRRREFECLDCFEFGPGSGDVADTPEPPMPKRPGEAG